MERRPLALVGLPPLNTLSVPCRCRAKKIKRGEAPAAVPAAAANQALERADDSGAAEAEPSAGCSPHMEGAMAAGQLQGAPGAAEAQQGGTAGGTASEAVHHSHAVAADDAADATGIQGEYACTPATPVDGEDEATAALQVGGLFGMRVEIAV